mgnify:CR=1 FL=1
MACMRRRMPWRELQLRELGSGLMSVQDTCPTVRAVSCTRVRLYAPCLAHVSDWVDEC